MLTRMTMRRKSVPMRERHEEQRCTSLKVAICHGLVGVLHTYAMDGCPVFIAIACCI